MCCPLLVVCWPRTRRTSIPCSRLIAHFSISQWCQCPWCPCRLRRRCGPLKFMAEKMQTYILPHLQHFNCCHCFCFHSESNGIPALGLLPGSKLVSASIRLLFALQLPTVRRIGPLGWTQMHSEEKRELSFFLLCKINRFLQLIFLSVPSLTCANIRPAVISKILTATQFRRGIRMLDEEFGSSWPSFWILGSPGVGLFMKPYVAISMATTRQCQPYK